MNNEEENKVVRMTEEELQHFVQAQVEKDEQLVRRQAQLAQIEEWVKQKERQVTYNRLLYNNACESVLECESVMKGLYGMLGLEYKDSDSEEEGEGQRTENVIQIADDSDSEEYECGVADGDDDYVVIDLGGKIDEGGAVAAAEMGAELKDDRLSADLKRSGSSVQGLAHIANKTVTAYPPDVQKSTELSTPVDVTTNRTARPSSSGSPPDSPLTTYETRETPIQVKTPIRGNPVPKSPASSTPLKKTSEMLLVTTVPATPCKPLSSSECLKTTVSEASASAKQGVSYQSPASTQIAVQSGHSSPASSETASLNQGPASSDSETQVTSNTKDTVKVKCASPKSSKKTLSSTTCSTPTSFTMVNYTPPEQSKSIDPTGDKPASSSSGIKATVSDKPERTDPKQGDNPASSSSATNAATPEKSKRTDPKHGDKPASASSTTKAAITEKSKRPDPKQGDNPASSSSTTNAGTTENSERTEPKQGDKLASSSSTTKAATPEKSKRTDPKQGDKPASSSSTTKAATPEKSKRTNPKQGNVPVNTNSSPKASTTKEPKHVDFKQGDRTANCSSSSHATASEKTKSTDSKQGDTPSSPNLEPKSTPTKKLKNADPKKDDKPTSATSASNPTTTEKSKTDDPKDSKTSSSGSSPTVTTTEKSKSVEPQQDDKPASSSLVPPNPSASSPQPGSSNPPASDKNSKPSAVTTSAKPPDAKDGSQASSATSTVPAHVQKEVELKVNMSILGRRRTKTWHQGTILDIKTTETTPRYKVLFEGGKGKSMLSAHHLACVGPPMLKDLFVGCRVVAAYKEADQSWFHAAIIAEMPDRRNRMRFLVFFDDGRPAYIALPDLHLVCKPLQNMSEDIEDGEWRKELEEYLQSYPNPIFVVMRVGQETKVKRDGELEPCTVTQVDGSLIQVCYMKDQEKEWLYKGSDRLDQIQRIKKRMAEQKKEQSFNKAGWIPNTKLPVTTATATPTSLTAATATVSSKSPAPQTVSTVTSSSASKTVSSVSALSPSSSTAKTITIQPELQPKIILNRISCSMPTPVTVTSTKASTHTEPTVTDSSNKGIKRPTSEAEDDTLQNALLPVVEPRLKYVPHRCCPACLNPMRPSQRDQHRGQNPLLIPLVYGFRRMTARRRLDGKVSFHVFYRAPCGRSMCQMEEVQDFLFESRCDFLYLEMFCLDPFVLVKRALLPSSMNCQRYFFLRDLSHGKEIVPIRCVNEIDCTPPPSLTYTRDRQPAPGVEINTNLDFMVGCDCTDGCRDRSKCACHQLTIEATSLFTDGPVDVTAGYTHKRLPKYVPTGVYECNPLCRCDPWLCGNRLVQHGIQLRLEVFMTQHKGWGIRCLDDISKGTFVCVFTGKITTDEMVNMEGDPSGNEYLANLDYIEGVEKLKEGYESEAYFSEAEESDKKTLITMTTGALKKHGVFQLDTSSSSGEEQEEPSQQNTNMTKVTGKRKRKEVDSEDEDSEDDDELSDKDYNLSSDDDVAQLKYVSNDSRKNYMTRRNAKTLDTNDVSVNDVQKPEPPKVSEDQTQVTASVAKQMRKEGPGDSMMGFAKKSTRAFAIKSSHRRVKPLDVANKSVAETKVTHVRRNTRSLFAEKACYLIDAKQEGNLARYINHSCSPNLFVQNVFVDTHDLRFPWVAFFTSKRIRAGTELTWDYSYELGSVEGKVLLCCCGSAECTGRLL